MSLDQMRILNHQKMNPNYQPNSDDTYSDDDDGDECAIDLQNNDVR